LILLVWRHIWHDSLVKACSNAYLGQWDDWHHCLPLHACFVVNFVNFACCGAVQNITVDSNSPWVQCMLNPRHGFFKFLKRMMALKGTKRPFKFDRLVASKASTKGMCLLSQLRAFYLLGVRGYKCVSGLERFGALKHHFSFWAFWRFESHGLDWRQCIVGSRFSFGKSCIFSKCCRVDKTANHTF